MSRPRWRLKLFGTPLLRSAAGPSHSLMRRDAAWLALVALSGTMPSAQVASLVWPGAGERGALNNLRQRLYRLRKATAAKLLAVTDMASLADDLELEPRPGLAALEADPGAWDGQLLSGIELDDAAEFSAWLAAERKAWTDRRRDALAAIASACETAGELALALRMAQRLLADDPLSEHSHRRLMRLHYLRGDTAAAVAAFEACECTLKAELGLKPSTETVELLATVERGALPASQVVPLPSSLLRPPRIVGRDRQIEHLHHAHAQGGIAVLVGEAGMGKSRLLQEFVAVLREQTICTQARPGDAAVPYAALARLLRAVIAAVPQALAAPMRGELSRLVPEIGIHGSAVVQGTPAVLQAAIEALLCAAIDQGRHTLVADDLHFADRASIEMLRRLVDAERLEGVRWLFAHRPLGGADEDAVLLRALAESPRARWIALAALTKEDLARLLESLALPGLQAPGLVEALTRHTGGNPLYVLETLRAMQTQAGQVDTGSVLTLPRPESIGHVIDRRLRRLSEPALSLARVAAIAVPDFSVGLAAHVLGTPAMALAGAWHELEAAEVLRGEAFAHDLLHDAILRLTPQALREHAHRQVAAYLDRHAGEPGRVAAHWERAGDAVPAAGAWLAAADRARGALRMAEEATLLQHAAALLASAGEHARCFQARVRVAALQTTMSHIDAARQVAQSLLDTAEGDAERLQALGAMMDVHSLAMEDARSLEVAQQLIDAARASGDERAELRGWRGLAAAHAYQGRHEQALLVHEARAGWIEAQPPREDLFEWAIDQAFSLERTGRAEDAVDALARVVQRALSHGYGRVAYDALTNQVMSTFRLGRTAEALELALSAERLARGSDAAVTANAIDQAVRGAIERDLGHFDEAVQRLVEAIDLAQAEGATAWLPSTHDALALTYARLGQHHRAARLLDEPFDKGNQMEALSRLLYRTQAARLDPAHAGGLEPALHAALAAATTERLRLLVLLELLAGADAGPGVADEVIALAPRCGGPGFLLHACLRRIDAQRRHGDIERAAFEARPAIDEIGQRDAYGMYRPEALLICARALQPADGPGARRLLEQAAQWIWAATRRIPDVFHESFLQRNTINRAVLQEFARA